MALLAASRVTSMTLIAGSPFTIVHCPFPFTVGWLWYTPEHCPVLSESGFAGFKDEQDVQNTPDLLS